MDATKHTFGLASMAHPNYLLEINIDVGERHSRYATVAAGHVSDDVDVDVAAELVRRWNAHGDLLKACRAMAAAEDHAEALAACGLASAAIPKTEENQ